ncbi:hypothetical protein AAF712_012211 [Marasmius tenuissimus]|uniref:Uncharacterized protein n=1 Tax=Marasmius tenuissimus TaxID=585030 RepID=A0ABR2ZIC9_9AGAR
MDGSQQRSTTPKPRRVRRVVVPSLSEQGLQLLARTLYPIFWEFMWNDEIPEGIKYIRLQLKRRGYDILKHTGDYKQDLKRNYYQYELIRKALYREARKGSGHRGRLADTLFLERLAKPFDRGVYAAAIPGRVNPDHWSQQEWRWMDKDEQVILNETPPSHRIYVQLAIENGHVWRLKDYDDHPRQAPVLSDRFFCELHTTFHE